MADNVPSLAAAGYAKFPKTDTATYLGMREAFGNAIATLKGKAIKDGDYAAAVKEALHKAVDDNDDLKSAGTQELVKRYFDNVIDRQPDDAHVKDFLKDIFI